jgi:ankyrin repeat protein
MSSRYLHLLASNGELPRLKELLASPQKGRDFDINAYDGQGYTPLMRAVTNPKASVDLVRLLLDHGADIDLEPTTKFMPSACVMALALGGGNPEKVALLLQRGANIHYRAGDNYGALLHAVHSREILKDDRLIDLLNLLIANGVELNDVSSYSESGLRVLSRISRFDGVKLLLDAGADAPQLQWTTLHHAIALGSLEEVQKEIEQGAALEDKDWWERTAWLLAIQTGEIAKAKFLYERGANTGARGKCGKPALFYAIETHHTPMLRWLLEIGASVVEMDDFGGTALWEAVESNNLEAVNDLLEAGADINHEKDLGQTALSNAKTREIAQRLLEAGADPQHLSFEGRRALLGLEPEPNSNLFDVPSDDFRASRTRCFGESNPEKFQGAFFENMVLSGIDGYQVSQLFRDIVEPTDAPVWCARRFGQSITFLPDGRIIQIGGEHEDYYDPDFCIYNDVFVHKPDGKIDFFGYPETVFPPTDFHTATLLGGRFIWVIGSLGYAGKRRHGKTQVYRLDTNTMEMELIETTGDDPGWIHRHNSIAISDQAIRLSGGTIVTISGEKEVNTDNVSSFTLDTEKRVWMKV